MTLDPPTILALTVALAAAAALYLAIEWRSVREPSLLFWSAGFATITVGSPLALLRINGYLLIGIWFANGLLVSAHVLFLLGVARFTHVRLSPLWLLMLAVWLGMLMLPTDLPWSKAMLGVQSLLVALPTLRASFLLRPHGRSLSIGAVQLRYVLLVHGSFYLAKALSVVIPGTLIDLAAFKGEIIQVSLVEGAMAIMLIALSMTGSERYRREQQIARLAARDPLTALYNRHPISHVSHPASLYPTSRNPPSHIPCPSILHPSNPTSVHPTSFQTVPNPASNIPCLPQILCPRTCIPQPTIPHCKFLILQSFIPHILHPPSHTSPS